MIHNPHHALDEIIYNILNYSVYCNDHCQLYKKHNWKCISNYCISMPNTLTDIGFGATLLRQLVHIRDPVHLNRVSLGLYVTLPHSVTFMFDVPNHCLCVW